MTITVSALRRYPVKGLGFDPMDVVDLAAGRAFPCDRAWALAHEASQVDPLNPAWMPKANFLNLAKDERLAQIGVRFDPGTTALTLMRKGKQVARGRLDEAMGRTLLTQFLSAFLGGGPRGKVRIVAAPDDTGFSDVEANHVSILNLASLRDIERVARQPIDPARFRANILIDGAPAWAEKEWAGKRLAVGGAVLEGVRPIGRCAATEVNPDTAERDINLPLTLRRGFGHTDCGLYADVVEGGRIAVGDAVSVSG